MITLTRPPLLKEATEATLDDLYRVDGKAELVNGKIVHFMATGRKPFYASFTIAFLLRQFVEASDLPGITIADNAGFVVDLPNRKSFSPDAGYYEGPDDSDMKFFDGAPLFAVEVRSENDYGIAAEAAMAAKRRDYFAAKAQVLWDVDLQNDDAVIRVYRNGVADVPSEVFKRGDIANAEPVIPGWTLPVDRLFERKKP